MPSQLPDEEFEDLYTDRFRDRLRGRGIILKHERDRAAIDLGIHLHPPGSLALSNVRVWLQLKGFHATTLSSSQLQKTQTVAVKLKLDHLRFWYASQSPYILLSNMLAHRSMRIDGPAFRGRPLGHRFDPLRSQLDLLDPKEFDALVSDLLDAHGYRIDQTLDTGDLLSGVRAGTDRATLSPSSALGS